MAITSAGIGSGLDIEGLLARLIAAERQPVTKRLDTREARLQAELSGLGALKGALSSFQSVLAGMAAPETFRSVSANVGDEDVFTASASTAATGGRYDIDVSTLASAHSLASGAFTSKSDPIAAGDAGIGTLAFRFGTTQLDAEEGTYAFTQNADRAVRSVTIDAGNNSLEGIRDAVNGADIGVSASIIHDGSGYRLVFMAEATGAANSLQVSVAEAGGGDGDDVGLSQLAFNASARHMTQTRAAEDAALSINGLAVTSASNRLTDTIEGVTIELLGAGASTLTISQDKSATTKAVDSFVSAYNKLIDTVGALTRYDPETRQAAVLTGDSAARGIMTRVRNVIGQAIDGLPGAYTSLAAIGIKTDPLTGKLEKDADAFQDALEKDFDAIARLFAATGESSDRLVRYAGAGDATTEGGHAVEITRLATRGQRLGEAVGATIDITAGVNDTFTIEVDGVASTTITLTPGSYSGAELAAELQARINGDADLKDHGVAVEVAFDTDHFVITSARYGSASKVTAAVGAAAGDLGLAGGSSIDGLDVAGTIGGVQARGSGRFLTGTGAAEGLRLEVLGDGTGARGSVTFTRGYAERLNSLLERLLGEDSILDARSDGLRARIGDIAGERERLDVRLTRLEARYRAQFTALDVLVSQLQGTSSFLSQQLANLPGPYRRGRD